MSSNYILSPLHINKLNHEIEEIRCRALNSVYTKYELNLIGDNDQDNMSQLFLQLLKWFDYDNRIFDEKAINLLSHISSKSVFKNIVYSLGVEKVLTGISLIEKKLDKQFWKELSDVKEKVLEVNRDIGDSFVSKIEVDGYGWRLGSLTLNEPTTSHHEVVGDHYQEKAPVVPIIFPWLHLATSDNKILSSSFECLRDLDDTQSIIQSTQFLKDIIIEDFPIEIFLQRPRIIKTLFEHLKTKNEQTHPHVLDVLVKITNKIRTRIKIYEDPCMRGAYINPKIILNPEEIDCVKHHQLSVQEFCNYSLHCLWSTIESFQEKREIKNYIYVITSRIFDISEVIDDFETFGNFADDNIKKINYYTNIEELMNLTISLTCSKNIYKNNINWIKWAGDPGLVLFYGNLHCEILKSLNHDQENNEILEDLREGLLICQSMDSAILLAKNKSLSTKLYFECIEKAFASLEFHHNAEIISNFFKICINNSNVDQNLKILLKLISHSYMSIQFVALEELYSYVLKFSSNNNDTTGNILFHNDLWRELLFHGGIHKSNEVQNLCKDILTALTKILFNFNDSNSPIFKGCVESNLALLTSYADTQSLLGRSIVRLFEPGDVQAALLPFDQLLIANLQLLFNKAIIVNEEAFARLCWLLTKDDPSEKKLPKVRDIKGLHLSSVCANVRPSSIVNKGFSNLRALNDCLATLNNSTTDIVSNGAALNELATIMQDDSLHSLFLEQDGLLLMLNILDNSLIEEDVRYLPAFVIPIIAVLKNIVLAQSSIRKELCKNPEFICNILRSLLLFTSDENLRQNSVQLLFFLLYNSYILEVKSYNKEFSISSLLKIKIHVPIFVREHDLHSLHKTISNRVRFMGNKNVSRLLRVYWAAHWMGDIPALLMLNVDDLENDIFSPGLPDDMKLTASDLISLQSIALRHNLVEKLHAIENADSHASVMQNIHKLTGFLLWVESYKKLRATESSLNLKLITNVVDIDNIPWEESFNRFFIAPPSCNDDEILLGHIINFLKLLIRVSEDTTVLEWLSKLVTDQKGVALLLIREMGVTDHSIEARNLRYGLIELAQEVIVRTAPHFDPDPWIALLEIISSYLESNYSDHLDVLLGFLADITGAWSWNYTDIINLYQRVVTSVTGVIFWYKGLNDVQDSFMGSNMINNALIVLGNLMTDASTSIKGWEQIWRIALTSAAGVENRQEADYLWLLALMNHRDPITRAAALSFLSSFFISASSFQILFDSVNFQMSQIWMLGLDIALESTECSLVREKASLLLERLTALGSRADCTDFLDYIKSEGIYSRVGEVISTLHTNKLAEKKNASFEEPITTFSLVGSLCNWLYMMCKLKEAVVTEQIVDNGLFEILLSKYCDVASVLSLHNEEWYEMSFSITRFVRTCVQASLKARDVFCQNTEYVRSFCAVLEEYMVDSNINIGIEEAVCLISTILETEEGVAVFKNALHACRLPNFFQNILNSLQSEHRLIALSLVNNLATQDLSHYFIQETNEGPFGDVLCEKLLSMDLKFSYKPLGNLFIIYKPAQIHALESGFSERVLQRLRKIADTLNKFALDDLRKPARKKQIVPLLNNIEDLYQMLTNFCYQNLPGKTRLAEFGLADALYKLWSWYGVRPNLIHIVLNLLHTFTYKSEKACQSLALTSALPGAGNVALIHSIAHLAVVEMSLLSKIKDSTNLKLALQLLSNSCEAVECRCVLARSTILTPLSRLLPSANNKKLFNDNILKMWLKFLNVYTSYPEGQYSVSRDPGALEFILWMAGGLNTEPQLMAFKVLVHLTMNPQNRCQLLSKPGPLLNLLMSAFRSKDEKIIKFAAAIIWSLSANSHKSKVIFRSAGCENAIIEASKMCNSSDCLLTLEKTLEVLNNK